MKKSIKFILIFSLFFFNNIKVELSDHIQTIVDEVNSLQGEFNNDQDHQDFLKR